MIPRAHYNSLLLNGEVVLTIVPSSTINTGQCRSPSFVSASLLFEQVASDCNADGVLDVCDPLQLDSDGDGVADECDNCPTTPNTGQVDCDADGVGDTCALAERLASDCNANGIPDSCELGTFPSSPPLSPVDAWQDLEYIFANPPTAVGDVVLDFLASADLSHSSEYVSVYVNDSFVARVFGYPTEPHDCPVEPDVDQIVLPGWLFNDLVPFPKRSYDFFRFAC